MVTVAEGGGMFAVEQATGEFLWARPFPYDDPNINMNYIDLKTGKTRVNYDKAVQEGWRPHPRLLPQYARVCGQIAYHPADNSLYVPFQDQCLSMTANVARPDRLGAAARASCDRAPIRTNT